MFTVERSGFAFLWSVTLRGLVIGSRHFGEKPKHLKHLKKKTDSFLRNVDNPLAQHAASQLHDNKRTGNTAEFTGQGVG
jgi:hypothetical protein